MLVFPQLSTGATAQYPIRRHRSERAVFNISEDGSVIALWDQAAGQVKWNLSFTGLTDQEIADLSSFHELCEGPLQPFLFLDPTSNLLAYSESFTQPVWQANSLLSFTPGITDPYGTTRATKLQNNSLGNLSLTQTCTVPGYTNCVLSVYARSDGPSSGVSITRSDGSTVESTPLEIGPSWLRFSLSSAFASSISNSCEFSITIPPGETMDLFGFQLEAQPIAGTYLMTSAQAGVFPNTRFDGNQIVVTATGLGESSLSISLLSPSGQ